jgi:hypothetical protein
MPLAFGFYAPLLAAVSRLRSLTVLGWQLSFVAVYWIQGRTMPVLLVSVGAIMGQLQRIHRLRAMPAGGLTTACTQPPTRCLS